MNPEEYVNESVERIALRHLEAGQNYACRQDWLSAADEYRKALSTQSIDWGTNYEANVYLAYALIHLGEPDQAIAHCYAAMKIRDRHPLAYAMLGLVMQSQRRWNEAARCFIKATRRNPAMDYAWPHFEQLMEARPDLVKEDLELRHLVNEMREWREKLFSESPESGLRTSYLAFPLMDVSDKE